MMARSTSDFNPAQLENGCLAIGAGTNSAASPSCEASTTMSPCETNNSRDTAPLEASPIKNGIAVEEIANTTQPVHPALAENGRKGNKKGVSAAQRKREKRKLRKSEVTVKVETDTESVLPFGEANIQVTSTGDRKLTLLEKFGDDIEVKDDDPTFTSLRGVLQRFSFNGEETESIKHSPTKEEIFYEEDDNSTVKEEEINDNTIQLSRKHQLRLIRPTVGQLKLLVNQPGLVEPRDNTSPDPILLLHLKGYRNQIPVPSHWTNPDAYLSSKRGIAKLPYELPSYIRDTGITEMRTPHTSTQPLRSKMREKFQPKLGKLDVDYQKLHDAFFKYQIKPPLSHFGEIYYEGKEFETNFLHKKPGEISTQLKDALCIPPGAPPPWLINMQRYGPPPGFPGLKIPGLNMPKPRGAEWGYHPGGWGKPPVDEFNRPIYGDVLGVMEYVVPPTEDVAVERVLWGSIEVVEEEVEEDADSDEEDEVQVKEEVEEMDGVPTNEEPNTSGPDTSGFETPSGIDSSGIEIPGVLELRKSQVDVSPKPTPSQPQEPQDLYRVLPPIQKKEPLCSHTYHISRSTLDEETPSKVLSRSYHQLIIQDEGVEVSLDPSQLENMTEAELRTIHNREEGGQKMEKRSYGQMEDVSDLVADHVAAQATKKRKPKVEKKSKYKF
jgi:splicing factor 3B subunit 2